jgi:hypothetical protein
MVELEPMVLLSTDDPNKDIWSLATLTGADLRPVLVSQAIFKAFFPEFLFFAYH